MEVRVVDLEIRIFREPVEYERRLYLIFSVNSFGSPSEKSSFFTLTSGDRVEVDGLECTMVQLRVRTSVRGNI